MDEYNEFYHTAETKFVVSGAVDVLVKHVSEPFLGDGQSRDESIVAAQGHLVLQVHPGHHRIDALLMQLGKTQSCMLQEQVAGMLYIMQIVGIVDNTLDITLVVSHVHACLKNVVALHLYIP